MIGYPITYGDSLEEGNGLTSEIILTRVSEYYSNEENRANFNKGYKFGLLVFGAGAVLLSSKAAFASDNGVFANNSANGVGSCPAPSPGTPRGAFGTGALGIFAMKPDPFWVGFIFGTVMIFIGSKFVSWSPTPK